MKGRIRPIDRPRRKAMFHRVPMDVIDMPRKVIVVADLMFPKAALPDAGFLAIDSGTGQVSSTIFRSAALGNKTLDHGPAHRKLRITLRQGQDAMQMMGQQNPGIDSKGTG